MDYLRERQPAVDYPTLHKLSYVLGRLFWRDLELHHPGIASLHLPAEVAAAWKQRITTKTRSRSAAGEVTQTNASRVNAFDHLITVRGFNLDLAHWAADDPARWAPWAAPCPVRDTGIAQRSKERSRRKSRMDQRTRERIPVLPALLAKVDAGRQAAAERLRAAGATPPGQLFTAAGQTLRRPARTHASAGRTWAQDPGGGKYRDLSLEEHKAFWTWAAVQVLRHTGIRIEELTELSHHSFIQYKLPASGEQVPLLQTAPSKTDTERLLVISPELADVLSKIITRIRGQDGTVPLVTAYDYHERVWNPPMPLLFQHRHGGEHRAIGGPAIRELIADALASTGITDASGKPLRFVPHDFRRIFITDAIMHGMPPHIAQLVAGHRDIGVTLGYKAVYPEEVINAHRAFITRRRALRPAGEYRTPTEEEWAGFLGHFERRKLSLGTCGRSYATPCIHEHAPLPAAAARPRPAATASRNPRQPDHPHQRSPARRLDRRSRGPAGQPRRHRPETRPDGPDRCPPPRYRHPPGNARPRTRRRPHPHHPGHSRAHPMTPDLPAALRACARGFYPAEASAELLISHESFLARSDFTSRFIRLGTSITDGITTMASIDWPATITALDTGNLPCSGGEQRMLRLAASLASGIPVNLRDALSGLDDRNINLVITAVLHASGKRQQARNP